MKQQSETAAVEVSTLIDAPVELVFRYFSDPARFAAWFGSGSSIKPGRGGSIELRGAGPPATGPIEEWIENKRIVFKFGHPAGAGPIAPESSTVAVTFESTAGGTRVTLRHAGIPNEQVRRGAAGGWRAAAARLDGAIWSDRARGVLDAAADAWIAAWNETDGASRAALLERCFSAEGVFCDAHSKIEGRAALNDWIGGVLMMMPGMRLARAGAARVEHGYFTYPWSVAGPDGKTMASGVQFGRLDADLRIALSVGFWNAPAA